MIPAHRFALLVLDAFLLGVAWFLAYNLRFDFNVPGEFRSDYAEQMRLLVPWVIATHVGLFWLFRLYRGILRYVGLTELLAIGLASTVHFLVAAGFNLLLDSQKTFFALPIGGNDLVMRVPWTVLVNYTVLAVVLVGGVRFSRRLYFEFSSRRERSHLARTLVVGTGDLANSVLNTLNRDAEPTLNPVAIVSDQASRVGMQLSGVPVVATLEQVGDVIRSHRIASVLIALDEPAPETISAVVSACETAKTDFRIVPSLDDVAAGRVEVSRLRQIEIEDLLGRDQVELPVAPERNYVRGARVLVTGAGGSIGSELCRQLARLGPAKLILLGRGENSLFQIEQELSRTFPKLMRETYVCDVRDAVRVERLFARERPEIIFHAAAHKHVPLMESQPDEAIRNNVVGTAVVANLAHRYGARRFLMISTDKAVRPTSVMGATKRLAEMVVFSLAKESHTIFQAVRFGNVLGSRGSVLGIFRRQIEAGGPVTVTHPDVTRYFMTIPEAVRLSIRAAESNDSGRLHLLDMGKPVRIAELARNMIVLAGLRPGIDIKLEYTGLRPGEKLHEELLTEGEGTRKTDVGKVFSAAPQEVPTWSEYRHVVGELENLAVEGLIPELLERMRDLVLDFHPAGLMERNDVEALAPVARHVRREIDAIEDKLASDLHVDRNAPKEPTPVPLVQADLFAEAPTPPLPEPEEPESPPPADEAPAAPEPPAPVAEAPAAMEAPPEVPAPETAEEPAAAAEPEPALPDPQPASEAVTSSPQETEAPAPEAASVAATAEPAAPPEQASEAGLTPSETSPEPTPEAEPAAIVEEASTPAPVLPEPALPEAPSDDVPQGDLFPDLVPGASESASPAGESSPPALEAGPADIALPVPAASPEPEPASPEDAPLGVCVLIRDNPDDKMPEAAIDLVRAELPPGGELMLLEPGAEAFNACIESLPDATAVVCVEPTARLRSGVLGKLAGILDDRTDAAMIYADHTEDGVERVAPEFTGDLAELNDFGPVVLYHVGAVRRVGGADARCGGAWEHDLQLRLAGVGRLIRVPLVACAVQGRRMILESTDADRRTAFRRALTRRGAWLEEPGDPVPSDERAYAEDVAIIPISAEQTPLEALLAETWRQAPVCVLVSGGLPKGSRALLELALDLFDGHRGAAIALFGAEDQGESRTARNEALRLPFGTRVALVRSGAIAEVLRTAWQDEVPCPTLADFAMLTLEHFQGVLLPMLAPASPLWGDPDQLRRARAAAVRRRRTRGLVAGAPVREDQHGS